MTSAPPCPANRIRPLTDVAVRPDGRYVIYWMTAYRRRRYNFALQHAVHQAQALGLPLIVVDALRSGYRWASDRLHRFVIDGMLDNAIDFADAAVTYYPFLETRGCDGRSMLERLSRPAALVVTDDFPAFFHPVLYDRIVSRWQIPVVAIDSNGLLPMRVADRTFTVAHSFRRYLQKTLPQYLDAFPLADPLAGVKLPPARIDPAILERYPPTDLRRFATGTIGFDAFAIDHSVEPAKTRGGAHAASERLRQFIAEQLDRYNDDRNVPDLRGTSKLSYYLHFGHLSAHEIFDAIMRHSEWTPERIGPVNGKSQGFWNAGANIEGFLDELITWRELGFNMCHREQNYDRWESLPEWAKTTLQQHSSDRREQTYSLSEFAAARTHDPLWNASQRELLVEGSIHNYLRMLWGKKILHWTRDPHQALEYLIELNNRYALDGRDPNSYSGIFWVLGRYDRPWGPERPIFGKIRYMTSESTLRKFKMKNYMEQYL